MKKIIKFLICICLSHNCVFAQNEDIKRSINIIKTDTSSYIYGESTQANEEEAFERAMEQLNIKIEIWVKSIFPNQEFSSVIAKKIDNYCQQLTLIRGNWYNAFVYVNKDDIYALLPINAVRSSNKHEKLDASSKEDPSKVDEDADIVFMTELYKVSTIPEAQALLNSNAYKKQYYYGSVRAIDGQFIKKNNAILLIYNHSNFISAFLKIDSASKSIINLKTGSTDSFANYPGCDAMWIVKAY